MIDLNLLDRVVQKVESTPAGTFLRAYDGATVLNEVALSSSKVPGEINDLMLLQRTAIAYGVDSFIGSKVNTVTGGIGKCQAAGMEFSVFGRAPITAAIFGDSIFAAYGNMVSGGHSILGHLFANAGQPFSVTHTGGVSGENSAQILARIKSTVTVGKFQAVFIEMGTNNLNNMGNYGGDAAVAIADLIAKHKEAIDFCGDKVPFVFVVGMFPFQSAFGLTTAQKQVPIRVNSWLEDYCAKLGHCYLDGFSPLISVNGIDADTARMTDNFHPGNNGANRFGKGNAPRVRQFLRLGSDPWSVMANGSFATDVTSKQLVPNPMMYGNTGTLQNGATGSVPVNWTVRKSSGAGASVCVASIVPANIGPGFALRLSLTGLVDLEQWAVNCGATEGLVDPNGASTFVTQGDVFYFEGIVKTVGATGILKGAVLWGSYIVTGGALNGTTQYFYANSYTSGTADIFDADIGPALFRSPNMSIPTDATSVRFNTIFAQFPAGAAGDCVVEVEKLALVKI